MRRTFLGTFLGLVLAALGFVAVVPAGDDPAPEDAAASPPPIHPAPGVALERLLDCTSAAVREDPEALLEALRQMDEVCRNIHDPKDERYSSRLIEFDWGFHRTIETAIRLTAEGNMDRGFEQYQWVERGCRLCHVQAAKEGLYPPAETADPEPRPADRDSGEGGGR